MRLLKKRSIKDGVGTLMITLLIEKTEPVCVPQAVVEMGTSSTVRYKIMTSNSTIAKVSRGRPKTMNREQTLAVAMQAYWHEDVDTVSLNEICRHAEISKPAIYREFGNEDGMMKAVLVAYQKQVLAPVYLLIAADAPFRATLDSLVSIVTRSVDAQFFSADQTGEMPSRFAAIYIDAQLSNALSLLARGELNDEVKQILTVAFSMLG